MSCHQTNVLILDHERTYEFQTKILTCNCSEQENQKNAILSQNDTMNVFILITYIHSYIFIRHKYKKLTNSSLNLEKYPTNGNKTVYQNWPLW